MLSLKMKRFGLYNNKMAALFQTSRTNIVEHIKHKYEENELDEKSTCRNFRQVQTEGSRQVTRELPFYNLDMIISLGYRIKSLVATQFRRWATDLIKEYQKKGYALDDKRIKELGGGDYWKDLLDRIRDIRSSEKAEAEYQKFIQKNLSPIEKAYLEAIKNVEKLEKEG